MSNQQALAKFTEAREHFCNERFSEARAAIANYRKAIDYRYFHLIDHRSTDAPIISVVIVAYCTGLELLKCIQSVLGQNEIVNEVILVDHGGIEELQQQLAKLPILCITPPINLLPSEGRNLGAYFARGELIAFLDDDAIMAPGYLAATAKVMKDQSVMALRGRVRPKNGKANSPQHYDLGDVTRPAELNLEGNLVIRKRVFDEVGGFDPLMFGHEGRELTLRCKQRFPDQTTHYQPELLIWHDYAKSEKLIAKHERQELGGRYMQHKKEQPLMTYGVSILVRAGDDLVAANDFLASLASHNTYKPIEVLLWASNSKQALAIIRPYIARFFVRVLPAGIKSLGRVGQQARYESLCIVDMPTALTSDVLADWLQRQQVKVATILSCDKNRLMTLADTPIDIALAQLAKQIGSGKSKTSLTQREPTPNVVNAASLKKSERRKQHPNKAQVFQTATGALNSVKTDPDLAQRNKQAEELIKQNHSESPILSSEQSKGVLDNKNIKFKDRLGRLNRISSYMSENNFIKLLAEKQKIKLQDENNYIFFRQ